MNNSIRLPSWMSAMGNSGSALAAPPNWPAENAPVPLPHACRSRSEDTAAHSNHGVKPARRGSVLWRSSISGFWPTACHAVGPSAFQLTPPAWTDGLARNCLLTSPNSRRATVGFSRSSCICNNSLYVCCEVFTKTSLALKEAALVH